MERAFRDAHLRCVSVSYVGTERSALGFASKAATISTTPARLKADGSRAPTIKPIHIGPRDVTGVESAEETPFDRPNLPPHLFCMSKDHAIRPIRQASAAARLACAATFLSLSASLAFAQAQPGQKPKADPPQTEAPKVEAPKVRGSLDDLFRRLKEAKNPQEAKSLATQIERRLARSGSDTADLLAARANEVFAEGEPAAGIEIIDRVIVLKPDWAEAYHRRALMFFAMDDMTRALADLNATLQREPRHFGALTGLGLIFQRLGDQKRAFAAYAQAYEINPSLESVKVILDRMRPDVEGRDI